MDLKIGANGSLNISKNAAGDIVLVLADKEAISDQSGVVAIHPGAVSAEIVKLFGGSAAAQSIVGIAMQLLLAALPVA